jgi:hypothetical protein
MAPEDLVSRLLYRDGLMLVIDKPAGLPVHRGPKGGASLEDYFDALRFGLPRAPALAHRLDRETSGCLVLGRHRKALAELGRLFKNGQIGKTYWALVEGGPDAPEGAIDLPLGRRDETRGWWMKVDPAGQPSKTTWTVMGRTDVAATSPLVGEVGRKAAGGGASAITARCRRPPSPTLPHKGGGSAPIAWSHRSNENNHLARARAGHRPHASAARTLRRNGLADRGRFDLWESTPDRRSRTTTSLARDRRAALQEARSDPRHCAGAAADAAGIAGLRLGG